MRIAYRAYENGIEIVRCWCAPGSLTLPETIDGQTVKAVGAYAFSPSYPQGKAVPGKGRAQPYQDGCAVWEDSLAAKGEMEPEFCGAAAKSVNFPKTLESIGNYAFYGCTALKSISFSDRLQRLGAGVFTGCRQAMDITVDLFDGEKTCLKEICGEIRYELHVHLRHHALDGVERAELVFPEHYEEAVENTPARILYTQHHGSGNHFRQCFLGRQVRYADYDALFPLARAQESMEVLSGLICGRLSFPYQLGKQAEEAYRAFAREHVRKLAEVYLQKEEMEGLRMLTEQKAWDRDALAAAVEKASQSSASSKAEIISYLMQVKNRLFPPAEKTFEL